MGFCLKALKKLEFNPVTTVIFNKLNKTGAIASTLSLLIYEGTSYFGALQVLSKKSYSIIYLDFSNQENKGVVRQA